MILAEAVEKLEREVATLNARCAALESVAVDLLALVEAIAPGKLSGNPPRDPVRPVKGKLEAVSGSALRRREALLTAALGIQQDDEKSRKRAKRAMASQPQGPEAQG